MATTTWNVSKDTRIARRTSDNWDAGAGKSDYSPVGLYSGYRYRTDLGFSYSFSGMTEITSAILHVKTSGQYYVAFSSNPHINIYRITQSWSEGTSVGLSSSNATIYPGPSVTSTNAKINAAITTSESTWDTFDITNLIVDAFNAGVFYGVQLRANQEDGSDITEIRTRENSTSNDAYITVTYSTNTAPNAPTSLSPTGGSVLNTLTPTFTGTFSDPDSGDSMSGYQIIVYNDSGGTSVKWDSGTLSGSGSSFSKVYAGGALTGNTTYYWKGRTKDAAGAWGAYSSLQQFKVNSVPNAPSIYIGQSPTTDIKTLTPTLYVTHSDPDASDSSLYGYHIILYTNAGSTVWDSGDTSSSPTVTKSLTYSGPALSWQTAYKWKARTKDSNGAWGAYSGYNYFTTHTAGVPVSLDPTGGEIASSIAPTFVGSRASTADSLTSAQIRVYQSNGTTLVWDSGTFTSGVTSTGFSKAYGGSALSAATTYKWQARITSSVGGTSSYSSLQTFITPDPNVPATSSPVGSDITPVTSLGFTFTRSASFNRHQLYLYQSDGTTLVTSDTPSTYTATTSKTFTYSGTLSWNTTYKWKVRVSSDGGTVWSNYSGLTTFTTDSAGVPSLDSPSDSSHLGAPWIVDECDDATDWINGTSTSVSLDTSVKNDGLGSIKAAISGLASGNTSTSYHDLSAAPLDLSNYGDGVLAAYARASSLTNVANVSLRFFSGGGTSVYVRYDITPSTTDSWEEWIGTLKQPDGLFGTIDWSAITGIAISVDASGGSVTGNFYLDFVQVGSTTPTFEGTTYGGDGITDFRVRVYASNQSTLIWDSGDTAGSGTSFSITSGVALDKGSTYYWQARYTKDTGPTGNYSELLPFSINADPTIPTSLSPAAGDVVADTTTPHFAATFNDTDKSTHGDYPTYMEVEVLKNSDDSVVYTLLTKTGLVAASNTIYTGLAGVQTTTGPSSPVAYETEYKWRARYYDSLGHRGSWSSYGTFKPSQSPTATITAPIDAGTVTSPSFNLTWSMSSPGSKGQNAYKVRLIRASDSVTMVDTGKVYSSATTYVVPAGYMFNGEDYDLEVTVYDTDDLYSVDTHTVTADWAAPDPIQDFTVADDESLSASVLQWTTSNLDPADFRKYTIYRQLTDASTWDVLEDITDQSAGTYYDYTAANTVAYQYKITQWQIVPGDVDLESGDSDVGVSILDTDSWFVIGADRSAEHIFELPVVAAPFSEPVQQEVFEPLGTSRKVIVRGRVMGAEGTLQAVWPNSERETAMAEVAYIKGTQGPHILKSPFGDVWIVEFSGPNKEYAQGGHVTANITWTEVE